MVLFDHGFEAQRAAGYLELGLARRLIFVNGTRNIDDSARDRLRIGEPPGFEAQLRIERVEREPFERSAGGRSGGAFQALQAVFKGHV